MMATIIKAEKQSFSNFLKNLMGNKPNSVTAYFDYINNKTTSIDVNLNEIVCDDTERNAARVSVGCSSLGVHNYLSSLE